MDKQHGGKKRLEEGRKVKIDIDSLRATLKKILNSLPPMTDKLLK